jgi:hypothetical protein
MNSSTTHSSSDKGTHKKADRPTQSTTIRPRHKSPQYRTQYTYVEEEVDGLVRGDDLVTDDDLLDDGDVGIVRGHEVQLVQRRDQRRLLLLQPTLKEVKRGRGEMKKGQF